MSYTTLVSWVHRCWGRGLGAVLLLGLVACPLLWTPAQSDADTEAGLQVTPTSHDFGRVKRLGASVETTFTILARGETPLVIRRIWTS